jgi:adenylate kinase family enzyme
MARIVIFGNTSGGKSTLARRLSRETGLPHFEIDKLLWQPDWSMTPKETYQRQHAEIVDRLDWIIDGGGDLETTRARAEHATDIIMIDMPVWVHFWLAAERQIAWTQGTLEHPPAGISNRPPTKRLFQIIWEVSQGWMPVLRSLCDEHEARGKAVVRLKSIEEIDAFTLQAAWP